MTFVWPCVVCLWERGRERKKKKEPARNTEATSRMLMSWCCRLYPTFRANGISNWYCVILAIWFSPTLILFSLLAWNNFRSLTYDPLLLTLHAPDPQPTRRLSKNAELQDGWGMRQSTLHMFCSRSDGHPAADTANVVEITKLYTTPPARTL